MEIELNTTTTKYHGQTYNEKLDRNKFDNMLVRIWELLKDGNEYTSEQICNQAGASHSAYRNRISDLRVYHKKKISATRVRSGLWKYQYTGDMTEVEHLDYLADLSKSKGVGDKKLWGQYMRCIYAFSYRPNELSAGELKKARRFWEVDLIKQIKEGR